MEEYSDLIEVLVQAAQSQALKQSDLALILIEDAHTECPAIYEAIRRFVLQDEELV